MPRRIHSMPFGAEPLGDGGVRFRYWAPSCAQAMLEIVAEDVSVKATQRMRRGEGGWHECVAAQAGAGTRYRFRLADGLSVPDPASRCNPLGVHGPSEVVDPLAFDWQDGAWRGRPWHEAVLYELHVGSFTPEGSFEAAAARLGALCELGVTAVQLMPLAQFSGERGWGYDGVLPFAPHASYGSPDALKRLIDTAHGLGMMVMLDAVYNHFGPEGNYLPAGCPEFFHAAHRTPWGAAINFDAPGSEVVRRFFIDNALYWVEEFHLDGLRLDAVHAIRDDSPRHIVADIADALRQGPGRERPVHLVLENDANLASLLLRDDHGRPLIARAQWNDDLHHAAHVLATGEVDGYYADYADAPAALLGRALAEGFVYQGQPSATRGGAPRGEPSGGLPSQAFVTFLQTHDQIGNRAFGERLDALADTARVEALLACVLLAPPVPMLFMGEEFAASTPFLYFCDFHDELARRVTDGRRAEFAGFPAFADESARARIPDPNAVETFIASKLPWAERSTARGQRRLALIGELLALRRRRLVSRLATQRGGGTLETRGEAFIVEWRLGDGTGWCLRANFGEAPVAVANRPHEESIYRMNATTTAAGDTRLERNGVAFSTWPDGAR